MQLGIAEASAHSRCAKCTTHQNFSHVWPRLELCVCGDHIKVGLGSWATKRQSRSVKDLRRGSSFLIHFPQVNRIFDYIPYTTMVQKSGILEWL